MGLRMRRSIKIAKGARLNFELIDPSDALNYFRCNMKFLKTKGFQPIDRITDY